MATVHREFDPVALRCLRRCTPVGLGHTRTSLPASYIAARSEEHTSELQSRLHLVCRLLLEKKKAAGDLCRAHLHHRLCGLGAASHRAPSTVRVCHILAPRVLRPGPARVRTLCTRPVRASAT